MSSLLDPKMQLLDSFDDLDDAAYEEETTEYIVLDLGANPVPESIQIQDITGPNPVLLAGKQTFLVSLEKLVGTGILLSTAPTFEPVGRVESVMVLSSLPMLTKGKLEEDQTKKSAAMQKKLRGVVPRKKKGEAAEEAAGGKIPVGKVGEKKKVVRKKNVIPVEELEESEEQGEGQSSGGEASGSGFSRDEVMADA